MHHLVKKEGYSYAFNPSACEECQGRCCTGESGYIYVSKQEMKKIAKLLEMNLKIFMDEYIYKNFYMYNINEIKNGDSHECIFYDVSSNGCTIYDARPTQCKTFPFWDYYKTRVNELKLECPGIKDV